jgi:hypothetical protein
MSRHVARSPRVTEARSASGARRALVVLATLLAVTFAFATPRSLGALLAERAAPIAEAATWLGAAPSVTTAPSSDDSDPCAPIDAEDEGDPGDALPASMVAPPRFASPRELAAPANRIGIAPARGHRAQADRPPRRAS